MIPRLTDRGQQESTTVLGCFLQVAHYVQQRKKNQCSPCINAASASVLPRYSAPPASMLSTHQCSPRYSAPHASVPPTLQCFPCLSVDHSSCFSAPHASLLITPHASLLIAHDKRTQVKANSRFTSKGSRNLTERLWFKSVYTK